MTSILNSIHQKYYWAADTCQALFHSWTFIIYFYTVGAKDFLVDNIHGTLLLYRGSGCPSAVLGPAVSAASMNLLAVQILGSQTCWTGNSGGEAQQSSFTETWEVIPTYPLVWEALVEWRQSCQELQRFVRKEKGPSTKGLLNLRCEFL